MRVRTLLAVPATLAALLALTGPAQASVGDTATARFGNARVTGQTVMTQPTSGTVTASGAWRNLPANLQTIFTVAYPNETCNPAAALPFGPIPVVSLTRSAVLPPTTVAGFYTNGRGADLGAQRFSISVRRGDTQADIDGDGVRGPVDVVAVPGKPWIGLLQCQAKAVQVNVP